MCSRGPDAGSFYVRSPAMTVRPTHADRSARLRQTRLLPVRPLCSIRRSQGDGVSRPIALPACRLLGPTVPCPDISAVCARRPAALPPNSPPNPTFALLAEYQGLPVTRPAERTRPRADFECRCIMSHAASQSRRSACKAPSDRSLRGESRVLTERRRRCVHPALILQYSGEVMRLGRPCVFGAVQVAPTTRIRPREVQRYGGNEAHGASKSRPSSMKLASVAYWYGPVLRAESSRQIRYLRWVNERPDARA
jgi:hypothetical protein